MKSALTEKWIVCRICLQQPNEQMLTIFNNDETKDMTQMILECGGVPIKQYDHYPDKICSKCLKYLRVSYKFRQTCQRSYKHLSRFIAPVDVLDKNEDLTEEVEEGGNHTVIEEYSADGTLLQFDDLEDSKPEMLLHLDPDVSVKEEFSEVEEGEVIDIYAPMDDDFEQIEEEFDSFDREISNNSDIGEYLEDIANDLTTEDDDFVPVRRGVAKKRTRGRQVKQEVVQRRVISKGRSANVVAGAKKAKRQPRQKNEDKEKLKAFICDVCGNCYPTQGRLKEHIKSHNGIKPYECEICGYAFAQNQQLARHMNTHTGNRPYKCNYCPSAFADLSTRNKHHRIHTNERPYVCDVCGKAFSYTNTLKFHKMIHTGEKPFVCDLCGKGFHQAYKLRNHKVTHEKRGHIAATKVEITMDGYQDVNDAAAHLLEI